MQGKSTRNREYLHKSTAILGQGICNITATVSCAGLVTPTTSFTQKQRQYSKVIQRWHRWLCTVYWRSIQGYTFPLYNALFRAHTLPHFPTTTWCARPIKIPSCYHFRARSVIKMQAIKHILFPLLRQAIICMFQVWFSTIHLQNFNLPSTVLTGFLYVFFYIRKNQEN